MNKLNWKRALISLGIGAAVILGGGIPLAISSGLIGFLAYSSIVVAIYAIFVSIQSLRLTRATQRPFLNLSGITEVWARNDGQPSTINYFVIHISNTGAFPADKVSLLLNVYDRTRDKHKHSFIIRGKSTSICFPSQEIINLIFEEENTKDRLTAKLGDELEVQIEISYQNKLTHHNHKTIRSYLVQYNPTARHEPIPLPEKDYWD